MLWKTFLLMIIIVAPLVISGCTSSGPNYTPISLEECQQLGGEFIADPGDGSVDRKGCEFGKEHLGTVPFGDEGGICCR